MNYIVMVLLCLHMIVCVLYGNRIFRKSHALPDTIILIIALIPVFGIISAISIELVYQRNREGKRELSLEGFGIGKEDNNNYIIEEVENANEIIPLEEALLINDSQTRRRFMMEILHKDPNQYLELLKQARFHKDTEITHYATSTIMEVQREYELELQRCISAYRSNPTEAVIEEYVKVMQGYLNSGLLDDMMNKRFRDQYNEILMEIVKSHTKKKHIYIEILENDIKRKEFKKAREISKLLQKQCPKDEIVWLKTLELCIESKDQKLLQQTLKSISGLQIAWTAQGKAMLNFLVQR